MNDTSKSSARIAAESAPYRKELRTAERFCINTLGPDYHSPMVASYHTYSATWQLHEDGNVTYVPDCGLKTTVYKTNWRDW